MNKTTLNTAVGIVVLVLVILAVLALIQGKFARTQVLAPSEEAVEEFEAGLMEEALEDEGYLGDESEGEVSEEADFILEE
jgi:Na+-transporting methylmalonyl-CoA/oxaloacetate decarboxylase gamma subunit